MARSRTNIPPAELLRKRDLKDLDHETGKQVFNGFATILRNHAVSDKSGSFSKIFNLFVCKIADEDSRQPDDVLTFQWRPTDTADELIRRLGHLYQQGMARYLQIDILADYFSPVTEFAFLDVYDRPSFERNARVLREVVELLQPFRLKYTSKHQFLGDFFEMLLNTGLKQEAGQFFTPVPLARFILKSLPLGETVPYVLDYACGSGHFLTEAIAELRSLTGNEPNWTREYLYGIEKDYRLAKTSKVAAFLNGDGDVNIITGDGLEERPLPAFDVVVSNPPFSISGFKHYVTNGAERYQLFRKLTDTSSEIECLFLERTWQVLKEGGVAGLILPISILNSAKPVYVEARKFLLTRFELLAMVELRDRTFVATTTTTVVLFLRKSRRQAARTLVAFSGEKAEQERFLGYRFSSMKGKEGIQLLTEQGAFASMLYDPLDADNRNTVAPYIRASFRGETPPIPPALQRHVAWVETEALLTGKGLALQNPSRYFDTASHSVASYSPFGDFLHDFPADLTPFDELPACEWIPGLVYPKEAEVPYETETRILTASNIDLKTGRLVLDTKLRYLRPDYPVNHRLKPLANDIVLSLASGSLKHLGKAGLAAEPLDAYIGGFLAILRCRDARVAKAIYYNLLSLPFRELVATLKDQSINNLTLGHVRQFPFHIPKDLDAFYAASLERERAMDDTLAKLGALRQTQSGLKRER